MREKDRIGCGGVQVVTYLEDQDQDQAFQIPMEAIIHQRQRPKLVFFFFYNKKECYFSFLSFSLYVGMKPTLVIGFYALKRKANLPLSLATSFSKHQELAVNMI